MNECFINVYIVRGEQELGNWWATRSEAQAQLNPYYRVSYRLRVRPKSVSSPKWEDMPCSR